jgi:Na+/melibiose symporter-like transporter
MEWTTPATVDDFERDVASGYVSGAALMLLLVLLVVVLIAWTPSGVVVPAWLVLVLVLALLFFPVRWALRRPWSLVANTPGNDEEQPAERWTGMVRGVIKIRQMSAKIARDIEVYSTPDMDGPLHPVD